MDVRQGFDPEIAAYYDQGREGQRLQSGPGLLEWLRTQEILTRFLPPPPATVFDVGGGTGVHALPLAHRGYRVHLVDPMPLHVNQALAASDAQPESSLTSAILGDGRHLPFRDASADAVLLFGPLYHLPDGAERTEALREAKRVLRPDGTVLAAVISRFAATFDWLRLGYLKERDSEELVIQNLMNGQWRNPTRRRGWFTTAYFHHPEDIESEFEDAGLSIEAVLAIEGPGWLTPDIDDWLSDDALREKLLAAVRRVEHERSLLGASSHIMVVARQE